MNFPVADAFEPSKFFLCHFFRLFSAGCRGDNDRALAAAKKPIVSGNFIDEANTVARHLRLRPLGAIIMTRRAPGPDDLNQFSAPLLSAHHPTTGEWFGSSALSGISAYETEKAG